MTSSSALSLFVALVACSCTSEHLERTALAPRQIDSLLLRADSFLSRGNVDSARTLYSLASAGQKNNARALTGLARTALAERDWRQALDLARQAIRRDTAALSGHYIAACALRERGSGQMFGNDDHRSSRREFEWIVRRDSSYEDVLYQYALLERSEDNRDRSLELVQSQVRIKPELVGPQVGLYKLYKYYLAVLGDGEFSRWIGSQTGEIPEFFRGELLRRPGNMAGADSIMALLLYRPGGVALQAVRLSLAKIRYAQGDPLAAEAEYWRGVKELRTDLGAAILFEDLKYIVTDGELSRYNSLDSVSQKRDFFRSFWNFRNPSLALGTNPRLQEHIRRFIEAEKKYEYYGVRSQFNNPDRLHELKFPAAFALNEEFNDMGLIFLRQGPPDDILRKQYSPGDGEDEDSLRIKMILSASSSLPSRRPNKPDLDKVEEIKQRAWEAQRGISGAQDPCESWLYDATPESPRMIFNFQKHNAGGNIWRLTPTPASEQMIADLGLWDSKYQQLYMGTRADRNMMQTQLADQSAGHVALALSTEKAAPEKKTESFTFPHQIDVFRAPDGRSLLDVSYAIPRTSLSHNLPDSVKSIPVEIGFSLVDAKSRHAASQKDTMQIPLSHSRTGAVLDLIRYTVPADSYAVSMHIRPLEGNAIGTWRQTLRVPDFSRPGFMMSSVQFLKASAEKGALAIDGVKVVQSPLRVLSRTEPMYVYFQLYHLVRDLSGHTLCRTEIILLPSGEKDPEKGLVVYTGEKTGNDEMAAVFCQVDIHSIDPGRYRLIVNATDRKRVQTLTAEREIEILK